MKKIIGIFLLLGFFVWTKAQETTRSSFDMNKVTIGGGFGAQFGDYTMITIAPQVGYNITNYFNAGVGISYSYYREKYYISSSRVIDKSHYAGFNIYGRLYLLDYFVVHAQPEINYMTHKREYTNSGQPEVKTEKAVPSFIVGAGFRAGPMIGMIKYDIVQDDYSPYGTKIFYSVGFTF